MKKIGNIYFSLSVLASCIVDAKLGSFRVGVAMAMLLLGRTKRNPAAQIASSS